MTHGNITGEVANFANKGYSLKPNSRNSLFGPRIRARTSIIFQASDAELCRNETFDTVKTKGLYHIEKFHSYLLYKRILQI